MRTTITLDDDVLDRARKLANERAVPFRSVVNAALRLGLEQVEKPMKHRRFSEHLIPWDCARGTIWTISRSFLRKLREKAFVDFC